MVIKVFNRISLSHSHSHSLSLSLYIYIYIYIHVDRQTLFISYTHYNFKAISIFNGNINISCSGLSLVPLSLPLPVSIYIYIYQSLLTWEGPSLAMPVAVRTATSRGRRLYVEHMAHRGTEKKFNLHIMAEMNSGSISVQIVRVRGVHIF